MSRNLLDLIYAVFRLNPFIRIDSCVAVCQERKKTIILFEEEMLSQSSNKNGLEPISCQELQPSCHIPFYTRIFCSAMYFRKDCLFIYDLNCRGAQLKYRGGPKKISPTTRDKINMLFTHSTDVFIKQRS